MIVDVFILPCRADKVENHLFQFEKDQPKWNQFNYFISVHNKKQFIS